MAGGTQTDLARQLDEARARVARLERELAARAAEGERQTALFAHACHFIALLSPEGTLLDVNRVALERSGYRREDLVGHPLWETPWWQGLPEEQADIRRAIEGAARGETSRREWEFHNARGELRVGEHTITPVADETGRVTLIIAEGLDITRYKRVEQELAESRAWFQRLVQYAPEAIVIFDYESGLFVDANENAAEMFGLPREELLKVGPVDMSPPLQPDGTPSHESARQQIEAADAGGAPAFEWTHRNARGEDIPCEVRLVQLPREGRKLVRGSITDITRRKEAEAILARDRAQLEALVAERVADLKLSEEKWRSLVSTAPDFIVIIGPDDTIQYINRTEPGISIESVVGTPAFDWVDPPSREVAKACMDQVRRTGEFVSCELAASGPDGATTWLQVRYGPLRTEEGPMRITAIATDVTARKKALEQLRADDQMLRNLLDLQERERQLVSLEIHDGFTQEVVAAKMVAEATFARLAAAGVELPPRYDQVVLHLEKAIAECRRMISELRPMVLDEQGVVGAIHYLLSEPPLGALDVDFKHDVTFERLEPMLEGTIFRIVQEALMNVLRHSGVEQALVTLRQRDDRICLEISDAGRGFVPAEVPGERFGVRGIRERARLFAGRATIRSRPGGGTTVRVDLPLIGPRE